MTAEVSMIGTIGVPGVSSLAVAGNVLIAISVRLEVVARVMRVPTQPAQQFLRS